MDLGSIGNMIAMYGIPIPACIGLAWFCKYIIDMNNKNIERMFDMYATANKENRDAIEANTRILEKLCDKLDKED